MLCLQRLSLKESGQELMSKREEVGGNIGLTQRLGSAGLS